MAQTTDTDPNTTSKLWNLLVGDPNKSSPPLKYDSLTSIVRFPPDQTLTTLIQAAYNKRKTAILKDRLVSSWLIDRLRTGLRWESDIRSLNADMLSTLSNITEFGEDILTETTLAIALIECFDSSDLASRSRLIYMMKKCKIQLPLTARVISHPSKMLAYVGCLNYIGDCYRNSVLCFGTDCMIQGGKDTLLQKLFSNLNLNTETDPIRSTTIELISHHDSASNTNLQILNVNGSFTQQTNHIRIFADVCRALVFSITSDDIRDDGSLNVDQQQQGLLLGQQNKLIVVLRDVDQTKAKLTKIQEFWKKYNIQPEKQYFLDNFMRPQRPFFLNIQERIRKNIIALIQDTNIQPNKLNPIQTHINLLQSQDSSALSMNSINVWQEIQTFVRELQNIMNSNQNIKTNNFPLSAVAEKLKNADEKNHGRRNETANSMASLDSGRDPIEDYLALIDRTPSPIINFFLNKVNTNTRMYFFEREIQAWKLNGEVYQLRRDIAEIQMNRGKPNEASASSSQKLLSLITRLDSIEWGVLDIWREIRIVRNLLHVHTSVSSEKKQTLARYYPALLEKPDSLKSITGRFATLFFSGFTVDAIDGTLLDYDHRFMEDVFRGNICQQLQGRSEQEFFVISVLGTQSTGKSTLLNNLFGCDMPVSAGRTTRGENVTCVSVDIPGCSVKNIVVQDFEGLMTMERGGSVFDKSICIYALATSDLVLLNTSRVIDAPTQDLLKYVMFAFYHLGLQEYRKPKVTFVLRDMASSDLTEFTSATKDIENAMISHFQASSQSVRLEEILEQINYMALASALHRHDSVWKETFVALRNHIFDNIRAFSQNVPRDHKNWLAWINACDSVWNCVRKNLNLLDAGTLAEMHFKEQMDKFLNEAINSPETIQRSKQRILDELDIEFQSVTQATNFDELIKRMTDKVTVEFSQCEESVVKFFVDRVGVVHNTLVSAYESYKNVVLVNVVAQSKEDTILIVRRKLEDARQKSCVDLCLQRLVRKIQQEASRGLSQTDDERNQEFERLWSTEEEFLRQCTDNLYQDANVIKKVHDCYRIIIINNHRHQPNNFDQLIHPQSPDAMSIDVKKSIVAPEPGAWERLKNIFRRDPKNTKAEDLLVLIRKDIDSFTRNLIFTDDSGFNKMNGTIRGWVQQLNSFLHLLNEEMIYDTKRALSVEFFKASHCLLYGRVCKYYRDEAQKEQVRIQSLLTGHKKTLRENYMSAVTNTYDDIRTVENLVNSIQTSLFQYATDENRLGLSSEHADDVILQYYDGIKSPEALDKLCYEKTFLDQDTEKTYNFIIDRRGFLSKIWEDYYRQYTPLLCNGKTELALKGNYIAGEITELPRFDVIQTEINKWFESKKGLKQISIDELLEELKKNEKLRPILSYSPLLLIEGLIIQDVSFVHENLQGHWSFEEEKKKVRDEIKRLVDGLKAEIRSRSYGCDELCPYCSTKCSKKAGHPENHHCHAHLIAGFGNCYTRNANTMSSGICTGDSWDRQWYKPGSDDSDETKYTFAAHLKEFYPNWTIQQNNIKLPPREQRIMFRSLNVRLCEKFERVPHTPEKWPTD